MNQVLQDTIHQRIQGLRRSFSSLDSWLVKTKVPDLTELGLVHKLAQRKDNDDLVDTKPKMSVAC